MTRRRRAVLVLIVVQFVLLLLGVLAVISGIGWLAFFATAASVIVVTFALIVIWRLLEMRIAALRDEPRAHESASNSESLTPKQSPEFLIGRAAGARQPVVTTYGEQERLLFGENARWLSSSNVVSDVEIAVIGGSSRYESVIPANWNIGVELMPGILESQAEITRPALVICDDRVFTTEPWRQAIDASGTWIIQDMQRLRRWVDEQGAFMVLFSRGSIPIGVNTAAIRELFNLVVSEDLPATGPEGAPLPDSMIELHRIRGLLVDIREGA